MKKIALSVLAIALIALSSGLAFAQGDGTGRPEVKPVLTTLDATAIACIKSAVIKREEALIVGFDTYATALKTARGARKDALALAWDKTVASERRLAVKSADKTFAESSRSARKTWNDARRAIWRAFEVDRKACNVAVSSADTGSPSTDASL